MGGGETFQQTANGRQGFEATDRAAAAASFVSKDGRVAQFTADGKRMGIELAGNQHRAADAFAEIHEEKIFAFAMSGMMAQRQNPLFLNQNDGSAPDFPDGAGKRSSGSPTKIG